MKMHCSYSKFAVFGDFLQTIFVLPVHTGGNRLTSGDSAGDVVYQVTKQISDETVNSSKVEWSKQHGQTLFRDIDDRLHCNYCVT